MKRQTAENLLRENMDEMSLDQLQRYMVKVIDAWRQSQADEGMEQAIRDGYYCIVYDSYIKPFAAPVNIWLTQNLSYRKDEVYERLQAVYSEA